VITRRLFLATAALAPMMPRMKLTGLAALKAWAAGCGCRVVLGHLPELDEMVIVLVTKEGNPSWASFGCPVTRLDEHCDGVLRSIIGIRS